jgi:hypothetical protein
MGARVTEGAAAGADSHRAGCGDGTAPSLPTTDTSPKSR